MKGSSKVGELFGIGIFVHWTFLLLIGWVAIIFAAQGGSLTSAVVGVAFVLSIFVCVVLHECGHAVMARRFGISTRDITLLPIGGIARLERMPEQPRQELLVAIAGPAVNVAIALGLFVLLGLVEVVAGLSYAEPVQFSWISGSFLANLMWINVWLVAFNLLPAFPMDGGRILRAVLATQLEYGRATQLAATIGQGLAVMLGVLGLLGMNLILVLIALFVFIGARQESQMVHAHALMREATVHDAMVTQFKTLSHRDRFRTAMDEALASNQQDFPVTMDNGSFGLLLNSDLMQAIASGQQESAIGAVARQDLTPVEETEPLEKTFDRMMEGQIPMLPVVRQGALVGLVTLTNLSEWLAMRAAIEQSQEKDGVEKIYRPV